jgi:hypothetical protein
MDIENPVPISQGPFGRLEEVRALLSRAGIPSEIVAPPDGKTNG